MKGSLGILYENLVKSENANTLHVKREGMGWGETRWPKLCATVRVLYEYTEN